VRAAALDAVTIDAYGTLVALVDPVPALESLLPGHGRDAIAHAFRSEAAFYRERSHEAHDGVTLTHLREQCVTVFNEELGSALSAADYVGALRFEILAGVVPALRRLRSLGLSLAVVGNWDVSLHERLEELGLASFFTAVVPVARKPSPAGIERALVALGASAGRCLHVGDEPGDEQAARAAGVGFAAAPLAEAVASIA
jgi:putative hydrolase of the HAD superfamily